MGDDRTPLDVLWKERFGNLPLDCGKDLDPDVQEVAEWHEWHDRDTTPDQRRIEDDLDRLDLSGLTIRHIGIGNSSLARRFSPRVRRIIGTTIFPQEAAHGRDLALPNYRPVIHNKYLAHSPPEFRHFDVVIDNNPTTFACGRRHVANMMSNLARCMLPTGAHLTDHQGLGWVASAPDANPRWKFSYDDWAALGAAFGLPATRLTEDIYALGSSAELRRREPRPRSRRIPGRLARLLER